MITITNISAQQWRKAATLKEKIQKLENKLRKLLGSSVTATKSAPRKRRRMSASARAKIAVAAKARWAKAKAAGKRTL
jgi:Cu/Ag efflux pump CusA